MGSENSQSPDMIMNNTTTEHFRNFLRSFDTAFVITHGQSTHFDSRPMVIAQVEDNCDMWFITNVHSLKVLEIEKDSRAHVICQNGRSRCATVSGNAHLICDRVRLVEIWKPAYRVWFPEGAHDPNAVLIKIEGQQGEYWDNTGAKGIQYIYRSIKAMVTGTIPQITEGEQHGLVDLEHR